MVKDSALDDRMAVAPQLSRADFAEAARSGFKSVVNFRPDGEGGDYLSAARAEDLASEQGLAYCHLPVKPGGVTAELVTEFGSMLKELPAPILGYCGSGYRAALMWALASAKEADIDEIIVRCRNAGHDLESLRPALESLGSKHSSS